MELPPSNRTRGWLDLGTDELARRAHAEPPVGMIFVVVGDPRAQAGEHGFGVRARLDMGVVTLERLHECLADAVALGAHGRETG